MVCPVLGDLPLILLQVLVESVANNATLHFFGLAS